MDEKTPDGKAEFAAMWIEWKKGMTKDREPRTRLLGSAQGLLQGSPEAVGYLALERGNVLARLAAQLGSATENGYQLLRGVRGGTEAAGIREGAPPPVGKLLSYTVTEGAATTFASMGNAGKKPGILYQCFVPLDEIVFFEDPSLCSEFKGEAEVLVLHQEAPVIKILKSEVSARASIGFSKKSPEV